jgi:uncharacterized protein Yka (UPF0111/DUF47 family)
MNDADLKKEFDKINQRIEQANLNIQNKINATARSSAEAYREILEAVKELKKVVDSRPPPTSE